MKHNLLSPKHCQTVSTIADPTRRSHDSRDQPGEPPKQEACRRRAARDRRERHAGSFVEMLIKMLTEMLVEVLTERLVGEAHRTERTQRATSAGVVLPPLLRARCDVHVTVGSSRSSATSSSRSSAPRLGAPAVPRLVGVAAAHAAPRSRPSRSRGTQRFAQSDLSSATSPREPFCRPLVGRSRHDEAPR